MSHEDEARERWQERVENLRSKVEESRRRAWELLNRTPEEEQGAAERLAGEIIGAESADPADARRTQEQRDRERAGRIIRRYVGGEGGWG